MSYSKTTLPNGVRILVEPVPYVRSAAIGLWCATGSVHEFDSEAGITHLIEHMLFKGTKNRTAKQIAEAIEGRGGMLNAFTDKEVTCYYCRTLSDDAENGIEVLCDMMRNSLIDPEELAREEQVVLEEIKRSEDDPEGHVHDLHLEKRWGSHPLGKPIIGTSESVAGFKAEHIRAYMERRYRGDTVVLSVAGNVDPEAIVAAATKLLGDLPSGGKSEPVSRPGGSQHVLKSSKDVEQVHFCVGTDAFGVNDPEIYAQRVLDGVLGGGMSSRLFQEIRERRGLAYSVGSYSLSYVSGGAFTVYGGTSPDTWPQVQELIETEVQKFIKNGFETGELDKVKRNLSGNLVLALEGMNARMNRMARNEIYFGRDIPVDETLAKLEAVTANEVQSLAERIWTTDKVSTTSIGPNEA